MPVMMHWLTRPLSFQGICARGCPRRMDPAVAGDDFGLYMHLNAAVVGIPAVVGDHNWVAQHDAGKKLGGVALPPVHRSPQKEAAAQR